MSSRLYVGVKVSAFTLEGQQTGNVRTVFRSPSVPTVSTHGTLYNYCIGPFRTKRGADFMANYGGNNPHLQTVADAERIAASK